MTIEADTFKAIMSQFASGVTIVTVQHEDTKHGLTASSFTSLSLDPPLILVCVGQHLHSHALIKNSGAFAVNILSQDQQEWGARFANPNVEDRYEGIETTTAVTGSPILPGSLAWADCELHDAYDAGDHTIFIGKIMAGDANADEGDPLLYYHRSWRQLTSKA